MFCSFGGVEERDGGKGGVEGRVGGMERWDGGMEGRDGLSPEGMEDCSRSREIEEQGLPVQRTLYRQCFLKQFFKIFYFILITF